MNTSLSTALRSATPATSVRDPRTLVTTKPLRVNYPGSRRVFTIPAGSVIVATIVSWDRTTVTLEGDPTVYEGRMSRVEEATR